MKKFSVLVLVFILTTLVGCMSLDDLKHNLNTILSDSVSAENSQEDAVSDIESNSDNKLETSSKHKGNAGKPQGSSSATNANQYSSKPFVSSGNPSKVNTSSKTHFNTTTSSDKVSYIETSSNKPSYVETSSKKTNNAATSSKKTNNTTTSSKKTNDTTTSSKQPSTTEPTINSNPSNAPMDDSQTEVVSYTYAINGTIVDWFVEGELVHAIFKQVNRYAVFDTTTGKIVTDKALGGRPAKIRRYGDELWISYPDLQCIKIHDINTFAVKNTISFANSVSSFDVYGDYLIFTEDDQHVNAYRYNMKKGISTQITADKLYSFYEADVLVNNELGYVYIAESRMTGSKVYCFDIKTLTLVAKYSKNNYGYMNLKRRTFLLGDYLYWGEFRLNAKNVAQVDGQYTGNGSDGMLHVDSNFVATTSGIFINSTFEQIASGMFNGHNSAIAITATGNMMITEQNKLHIFSRQ